MPDTLTRALKMQLQSKCGLQTVDLKQQVSYQQLIV